MLVRAGRRQRGERRDRGVAVRARRHSSAHRALERAGTNDMIGYSGPDPGIVVSVPPAASSCSRARCCTGAARTRRRRQGARGSPSTRRIRSSTKTAGRGRTPFHSSPTGASSPGGPPGPAPTAVRVLFVDAEPGSPQHEAVGARARRARMRQRPGPRGLRRSQGRARRQSRGRRRAPRAASPSRAFAAGRSRRISRSTTSSSPWTARTSLSFRPAGLQGRAQASSSSSAMRECPIRTSGKPTGFAR